MKTLEVTKENAIKAHDGANAKGRALLENLFGASVFIKDITERVKTIQDAFDVAGLDYDKFIAECKAANLPLHVAAYRAITEVLVPVLNEGWEPDYGNTNEYKYHIRWDMGGSSGAGFSYDDCDHWFAVSGVGSRLVFKSSTLAIYAGKQFTDLFKQMLIITKA